MDVTKMTLMELKDALTIGEITSVAAVDACLAQIEKLNGALNAFVDVYADEARAQAKHWDGARERGEEVPVLAGIPIAVKDVITIKGKRITAGSKMLENYVAPYDATVIERLKDAGAILIGTTNTDEFTMGSTSETSVHGPTRNPWDTNKIPGGSSGGSAAAVAAGMVPAALGSDTGGSVRQPATMCGVVGLKPSYGRVSRYGLVAHGSSFDSIGAFGRHIDDVMLILEVIEGKDPKDATSVASDVVVPELVDTDVSGMKIGLPKEYFVEGMDPEVEMRVRELAETLSEMGAEIVEISLPHTEYALATYYVAVSCEISSNMSRFDGIRYGHSADNAGLLGRYRQTRSEALGDEVKRRIMLGTFALSSGYYDAYYKKALQARYKIREDFVQAFEEVDLILTPVSPSVAWSIGEKFDDPLAMYLSDIYTISPSLAGLPSVSVPAGFAHDLPVGAQFIAPAFHEYRLAKVGSALAEATDWHTKTPDLAS